jgi:hypothetical protein
MKIILVLISLMFVFNNVGAQNIFERAKRKLEEMNQNKPQEVQSNASSESKKQDNSLDKNLIDFFVKNDKNEKFNIWGEIDGCRISNKKQQIIGDLWAILDNNQFSFSEFDKNSKHITTGKVLKLNLDSNDNKIIRIQMEFRMMEWDNSIPNMLLNSDLEIINDYTLKTKYVEVLNLNGANKQIIIKDGIHLKNNLTQINYKCDAPETIASIREIDEQVEANKRSKEDLKRVEIAKKEQELKETIDAENKRNEDLQKAQFIINEILRKNNLEMVYKKEGFVITKNRQGQFVYIKGGAIRKNSEVKEDIDSYNSFVILEREQKEKFEIIKKKNLAYRWVVQAQAVCTMSGSRCQITGIREGQRLEDGSATFSISHRSWRGSGGSSGTTDIVCGFNQSNTLRSTSVNAVCQ